MLLGKLNLYDTEEYLLLIIPLFIKERMFYTMS